ncbi:response regulator transcription factor [Aerococcaceae bacterium zg-ZJ1578]|uniref:response regulator transcription factor n=1 Tax=Aerococcaceae TaxID=186827 RepID=UPI0013B6C30B|nr:MULTISPECIES: response regulator transcription factor [unclassified Facklamia]MBK0348286.1 response regulator transcription factor [Aerococcaceae bacterium zg-1578]MBS4462108.1 response regulator transcription factor [Aerococcaceae bacterium zg-B36]QQD65386.1 response regulator transcription factor [Aerococcaceae bacterium zg-252]NEW64572.1 response regulator [Facklamia sp. 252]NEW67897.1 response regulator [Facklamia sp. 253]
MRLLLAEDEKDLARALAAILKHHSYEVDVVHNGEDALFYAESAEYDGLILDIMMPKKSGLEVLDTLRKRGAQTPILLLTAKNQLEDKVTGLDSGADDYITKPFDTPELLARVRSMLRRPATYVSDTLTVGDVTLDRSNYLLQANGQSISLNNREFQLMEMFFLNSNQVLSKELIMDRIWGLESEAEINVVWVNISSLRKKLQQLESKVKISAQRGLGYKLEVDA